MLGEAVHAAVEAAQSMRGGDLWSLVELAPLPLLVALLALVWRVSSRVTRLVVVVERLDGERAGERIGALAARLDVVEAHAADERRRIEAVERRRELGAGGAA